MKYNENGFYPAWLPLEYRDTLDLSELAEPTEQIEREVNTLMEIPGINIAIYKSINHTPMVKPMGLCSVFKAAILRDEQLEILYNAEQRLKTYVIVAYASPLQHHSH